MEGWKQGGVGGVGVEKRRIGKTGKGERRKGLASVEENKQGRRRQGEDEYIKSEHYKKVDKAPPVGTAAMACKPSKGFVRTDGHPHPAVNQMVTRKLYPAVWKGPRGS